MMTAGPSGPAVPLSGIATHGRESPAFFAVLLLLLRRARRVHAVRRALGRRAGAQRLRGRRHARAVVRHADRRAAGLGRPDRPESTPGALVLRRVRADAAVFFGLRVHPWRVGTAGGDGG